MTTRRDFLKASAAAAVATTATNLSSVYAAGSDTMKVGIIGCGGRGTGAGENVLQSAKGVEVVALADFFDERVKSCARRLNEFAKEDGKCKEFGNKCDKPATFSGLDAFQKVISHPGVNYVILATPPGFRPMHLQAAVAAGKNIFCEKPVAVDGPGIRTCFDVFEQAKSKNLGIVAGTQRRHQTGYLETVKALHDGAIGDVVAGRCYWNGGAIWFRKREDRHKTDLDYQMHNWYHFAWLCGDHIVEQHVHNVDVLNWVLKATPVRALGMGGRVLPCSDPQVDGHIFNYFAIDYEYPNGVHVLSMCRQVNNSDGNFPGLSGVSEAVQGTKGSCQVDRYSINGAVILPREVLKNATNPYVQEHSDLIDSIRSNRPLNELKTVTESTLTAIMGRMSAYTGKAVTWDQALGSKQKLMPEDLTASTLPVPPVAVPGRTPLV